MCWERSDSQCWMDNVVSLIVSLRLNVPLAMQSPRCSRLVAEGQASARLLGEICWGFHPAEGPILHTVRAGGGRPSWLLLLVVTVMMSFFRYLVMVDKPKK